MHTCNNRKSPENLQGFPLTCAHPPPGYPAVYRAPENSEAYIPDTLRAAEDQRRNIHADYAAYSQIHPPVYMSAVRLDHRIPSSQSENPDLFHVLFLLR